MDHIDAGYTSSHFMSIIQTKYPALQYSASTINSILAVSKHTPVVTVLQIYVDTRDDDTFKDAYQEHINSHNLKIQQQTYTPDAGFDLLTPYRLDVTNVQFIKIGMQLHISALHINAMFGYDNVSHDITRPIGLQLHSRSSTSNTPLRLAITSGIIDAGYRGELKAAFDIIPRNGSIIEPHVRLVQLVSPDMSPIIVELVERKEDLLLCSTIRGNGGFGSTGK